MDAGKNYPNYVCTNTGINKCTLQICVNREKSI